MHEISLVELNIWASLNKDYGYLEGCNKNQEDDDELFRVLQKK